MWTIEKLSKEIAALYEQYPNGGLSAKDSPDKDERSRHKKDVKRLNRLILAKVYLELCLDTGGTTPENLQQRLERDAGVLFERVEKIRNGFQEWSKNTPEAALCSSLTEKKALYNKTMDLKHYSDQLSMVQFLLNES